MEDNNRQDKKANSFITTHNMRMLLIEVSGRSNPRSNLCDVPHDTVPVPLPTL